MGPIQTFEDLIGLLVRRRMVIALVAILGTVLAAVYAKSRPDLYETAAVISVQQASVSNRAEGLETSPAQVLQNIEQRLMTRDNVIALIERHGLFADAPGLSVEDKVAITRNAIQFQSVSSATGGGLSAIIISAQSDTAEGAARIANDLAQSMLDMGAAEKRVAADATYDFFKSEEARLWQELARLDAETAAFRETHREALPANREIRQNEATEVNAALRQLDQNLTALQSEEARINAIEVLRATDRRRLEEITQQKAVLAAQRDQLAARKAALDAAFSGAAEVDRSLSVYDRQQRQLQDQYAVVSQRLAEAETARRLAENQQNERFSLLERAITPEYPLGSGGKRIAMAGAVASFGLGLALAFLLDLLHPALRTSAQVQRELNLTPIVAIPEVTDQQKKSRTRRLINSLIESEAGRVSQTDFVGNAAILFAAALLLLLLYSFI